MSTTTEVGISPVLLQAITHTLSSGPSVKVEPSQVETCEVSPVEVMTKPEFVSKEPPGGVSVTEEIVLSNEQTEMVTGLETETVPSVDVNGIMRNHEVTLSEEIHEISTANEVTVVPETVISDGVVTGDIGQPHMLHGMQEPMNEINLDGETVVVVQEEETGGGEPQQIIIKQVVTTEDTKFQTKPAMVTAAGDISMGNVLSAIASHLKMNLKRKASESIDVQAGEGSQPVVVSVQSSEVPQPAHSVTVTQDDACHIEPTVYTAQSDTHHAKRTRVIATPDSGQNGYILTSSGEMIAIQPASFPVEQQEATAVLSAGQPPEVGDCPICGDKISGYHYGIYTCESCKGFFKRTVQNKKAFVCPKRAGEECVINIANRKKCPACRFNRCLSMGMKLEAIRTDRTRGGRSSYDGCTPQKKIQIPHSTPKQAPPVVHVVTPISSSPNLQQQIAIVNCESPRQQEDFKLQSINLDMSDSSGQKELQIWPQTPSTLEDLMAVESLMSEEEEEQVCCEGRLKDGDQDAFGSLLHLADHCLYKIVRWARNLPDFANVSTDDQILLLQNCWAELLCLCVAWNSVHTDEEGVIRLSYGRLLTVELAKAVGLAELTQRILDLIEALRNIGVDTYEFVAMKSLLLITPDVKGLKDQDTTKGNQERIMSALLMYTTTHYVDTPNKFAEMLARLPELSRIACLAKTQLMQRQSAGEVPSGSLLSELLRGDTLVQQPGAAE